MLRHVNRAIACLSLSLVIGLTACGAPAATPTSAPEPAPTVTLAPTTEATATQTQAQAQAPTPTDAAAATATPAAAVQAPPVAPAKRSVWDTTAGPDQLKGDCASGSVVPPYGPVLITPKDGGGGFDWKDVQNSIYTFAPADQGAFVYAGPNGRKDGVITMTLRFLDAANFVMQAEFVKTDSPGCAHLYDYKGVYKFDR